MKLIAPSILSADFAQLGQEIQAVEQAGADWIHVDVMDGHFVPNITMGPIIVEAARRSTRLPLDVHLMIENPDAYIPDFARAGADYVCVHAEAALHLNRTIQLIKECDAKPGVALNPATSLQTIDWILEQVDFVLLMSVNPGFGGQAFIDNSLDKITQLRHIIDSRNLATRIQVDGGVNEQTIAIISQAGADIFVAGSAIFGSQNYQGTIDGFRSQLAGR
jgi:ribulose-phosphate 3-epimerase